MFLFAGLGNPGAGYANNRHNIGFQAMERLAEDYNFSREKQAFGGLLREGIIDGQKLFAFRPMRYMNNSGGPLAELAHFYKIPLAQITVFHDELDLPLGRLRVKCGGGHGGHNGLKSIDAQLGKDYWRVRLGIGHPGSKELVTPYVLSDFSKPERLLVNDWLSEISRHIALLVNGDIAGFMNKLMTSSQANQ